MTERGESSDVPREVRFSAGYQRVVLCSNHRDFHAETPGDWLSDEPYFATLLTIYDSEHPDGSPHVWADRTAPTEAWRRLA